MPVTVSSRKDGVYFGLSEEEYHADTALGSSGLKLLYGEPAEYWYSYLHPFRRRQRDAHHFVIGKAVHKYVLEGQVAFTSQYECEPEPNGLLVTADDLREVLAAKKVMAKRLDGKKGAPLKSDLVAAVLAAEPTARIDDVIRAKAAAEGRTILKYADFVSVAEAAARIRANPELMDAFQGGYPEVSVFWTEEIDGVRVRFKCRFDYLKPRATVDLKSTTPDGGMPFDNSCLRALIKYKYDVQAASYLNGRMRARDFIRSGMVYGEVDQQYLAAVAAANEWAFVFVFWASAGAPMTWGTILSPSNAVIGEGQRKADIAVGNYVRCMRRFGETTPWLEYQPLEELPIERLPSWYGKAA